MLVDITSDPGMKFTTSTPYFFISTRSASFQYLRPTFVAAYVASPGRACANGKYIYIAGVSEYILYPHLKCTVTGHIDDARFVFPYQWQEASREIHGAKKVCVDLILYDGIRLPFKFTEAHDARVIHQIAELQIFLFAQKIDDRFFNMQNAGAFANIQFNQMETFRITLVQQFLGAFGVCIQTGGTNVHV